MPVHHENPSKRQKLARYLQQFHPGNGQGVSHPTISKANPARSRHDDIAIIGMAGRFPNSPNLTHFWKNLETAQNLIGEIPPDRWDWQHYNNTTDSANLKANITHMGAIADVFNFDAKLFGISPREAETMDPHQRVMLEVVWETLEHAGYAPPQLAGSKTGVFMAMYNMDFLEYSRTSPWDKESQPYLFLGANQAITSNRISYFFNWQGPSEIVATACSSALVALHKAAQAIHGGECQTAIVGGVSLLLSPVRMIGLSKLGVLSTRGYCAPFDKDSPGEVLGEGAGAVLLKSLTQAEQDGDTIYAVLKATGTNHHGNSSGSITMPSVHAQKDLIVDTYCSAQIDPTTITFIEAHGSGNVSGDRVEIKAFERAFAALTPTESQPLPKRFCGLGSGKGNMGFLEAAGGMAQLIKTILSLQHKTLPATLNFTTLDESVDLENSAFYIVDKTMPWPALTDANGTPLPRRAAINSYGLGGTNAHVVVEEYQAAGIRGQDLGVRNQGSEERQPQLIVLSAKNEERLRAHARNMVAYLETNSDISLVDLAYTLQVGRAAMEARLAVVASHISMLVKTLTRYSQDNRSIDGLYLGNSKANHNQAQPFISGESGEAFIKSAMADKDSHQLGQAWVSGLEIDWSLLYPDHKPRRIALPAYPFAKERYWLPNNSQFSILNSQFSIDKLHPLVQRNTSTLEVQQFTSIFQGTEFFLTDHRVQGEKVLPGVAYLEMVRAAGEMALAGKTINQIKDLVWLRPMVVKGQAVETQISLTLDKSEQLNVEVSTIDDGQPVLHSQGKLIWGENTPSDDALAIDLAAIQQRCPERQTGEACYRLFDRHGYGYGPAFQVIDHIVSNQTEALAKMRLPAKVSTTANKYILHPSLMDGALQASVGLAAKQLNKEAAGPYLPFAIEAVSIYAPLPTEVYAYVQPSQYETSAAETLIKYDVTITAETGQVCVQLKGIMARPISSPTQSRSNVLYSSPIWQERPLKHSQVKRESKPIDKTLLLTIGLDEEMIEALEAMNELVELVRLDQETIDDIPGRVSHYVHQISRSLKAMFDTSPAETQRVIVLDATPQPNLYADPLAAWLKTARLEQPKLLAKVIQTTVPDKNQLITILRHEFQPDSFDTVDVRYNADNQREVKHFVEIGPASEENKQNWLRPKGVYWITGGLGALGRLFAQHLIDIEASVTLILSGRSPLNEAGQQALDELNQNKATVTYMQADVARYADVERVVQTITTTYGQLNGIIHSAGISIDGLFINKTETDIDATLAPKVAGTVNIDTATQTEKLDFMVLFSSMAAPMGKVGQAEYAAANAFLDALAHHRQQLVAAGRRYGKTVAINWPVWAEGGMGMDAQSLKLLKRQTGLEPLTTAAGLRAFEAALRSNKNQVMVAAGNIDKVRSKLLAIAPFADHQAGNPTVKRDIANSDRLRQKISADLRSMAARLLKIDLDDISENDELNEHSFDSIAVITFANQLNDTYDLGLSPTIFFAHNTLASLSAYLATNFGDRLTQHYKVVEPTPPSSIQSPPHFIERLPENALASRFSPYRSNVSPTPQHEGVAIIGISGVLPESPDVDTFWQHLEAGHNLITEIPPERWHWPDYFGNPFTEPNKTLSKWGGFIPDVDKFDPLFFKISPQEAEMMDPQHRLFLQSVWHCIEDAGYPASTLAGQHVGVYVGVQFQEYQELLIRQVEESKPQMVTGNAHSMLANRVSYLLDLRGPSEAIDTACSSSLVAIHRAVRSIQSGESEWAIAGGVSLILSPSTYIATGQMDVLSPDGKCKTFDKTANGFVKGEGVGAVLLKPLAQAEQDGDHIYGVIRGSAENHGGRASSLTAPNPQAQADVVVRAYKDANIDPTTISYIEAHGTGTVLGDPIEIEGLKQAFKMLDTGLSPTRHHYCGLGSVKTNIGHLEPAAGIAGVLKVLLAMKHKKLPAILHFDEQNPYIDLKDSPFYLVSESRDWQPLIDSHRVPIPRRAGISAFGIGGSNAHILVEEYQRAEGRPQASTEPHLIVLSAKNAERLKDYAQRLRNFLQHTFSLDPDKQRGERDQVETALQTDVLRMVAEILDVQPANIEVGQDLREYGLDQVQLNQFKERVEQQYQIDTPITIYLEAPSATHISHYLRHNHQNIIERCYQVETENSPKTNESQPNISLADIAHTLQTGREAMAARLALVVTTVDELVEQLRAYEKGLPLNGHGYQGNIKTSTFQSNLLTEGEAGRLFIETLITERAFHRLAQLWVAGLDFDWRLLYQNGSPRRISLPTYPFAKERYWIPGHEQLSRSIEQKHPSSFVLHPLVHRNTSTLDIQRFSTIFDGTEFFLSDHQVQGHKVLPGVAYLEMVRAAGEMAIDAPSTGENQAVAQIKNMVWVSPLTVKDKSIEAQTKLYLEDSGEAGYEIITLHETGEQVLHAQGNLVWRNTAPTPAKEPALELDAIRQRCTDKKTKAVCYRLFEQQGVVYGPSFQTVEEIVGNPTEALAQLKLPPQLPGEYGLHPSLLDGALQTIIGIQLTGIDGDTPGAYLPFALQEVNIYAPLPENAYAYVTYADGTTPDDITRGGVVKYNIKLTDNEGNVCVSLKEFSARALSSTPIPQKTQEFLYTIPKWQMNSVTRVDGDARTPPTNMLLLVAGLSPETIETISTTFEHIEVVTLPNRETDTAAHIIRSVQAALKEIQAIIEKAPATPSHIVVLTGDTRYTYLTTTLAAFLKSVHLEHPRIYGKTIVLSNTDVQTLITTLRREMHPSTFDKIEVRYDEAGTRRTKQFVEMKPEQKSQAALYLKPGGVYWITGGLGKLGRIFVQHLLEKGERLTLILSGRSELDERLRRDLAGLQTDSATIIYHQADVSRRADVERVVNSTKAEYGQLNGIIHTAGVIRDSLLVNKSAEEVAAVLAPKVAGLVNIDMATQTDSLDFMVFFSSVSAITGNVGQADYAAANAFLDAFAEHRQQLVTTGRRHGRTVSLNWPLWTEGGMQVNEQVLTLLARQTGMVPLATEAGLRAFEVVMASSEHQVVAVAGDVGKLRGSFLGEEKVQAKSPSDTRQKDTSLLQANIATDLKQTVSDLLKIDIQQISPDDDMSDYGFDSIAVTTLVNKLNQMYGLTLMPTLFFEHNTLDSLSSYLAAEYPDIMAKHYQISDAVPAVPSASARQPQQPVSPPRQPAKSRFRQPNRILDSLPNPRHNELIAIIGISGVMPQSPDLNTFWQHLEAGDDLISEIPPDRWDWQAIFGDPYTEMNKTRVKWGSFIADVDKFDAEFFKISPHEAELMDPQQRVFLETVWACLEDAGYRPETLSGTNMGLFVGVSGHDYQDILRDNLSEVKAHIATGLSHSVLANRISYLLNFHGPSEPIDTACSSALVAIHRAIQALHSGSCDMAIAGGINIILTPSLHLAFSQAGMLAEDGHCKTFDQRANGYVRGEGSGAIFLKPLAQAEADGDHIYAVIRGSAENHGGHTNSLTAPNPKAQATLLVKTYQQAAIDPTTVSYIEAHGTGTKLGDPIEVNGLRQAFAELYQQWHREQPETPHIGLGSVKTHVGHLESAAGIAGVLKVLLAMKHKKLPGNINFAQQNPYIDLNNSPFYLVTETQDWRPLTDEQGVTIPRRAGVSSFGFGGANAHVVLEEYQESGIRSQGSGVEPQLIVLSAKNEERLRDYAKRWVDFLETSRVEISLADIAYTLQVGREEMEERLAFVVSTLPELTEQLHRYYQAPTRLENIYRGNSRSTKITANALLDGEMGDTFIKAVMDKRDLPKLAQLWVAGVEIDWSLLPRPEHPQRISLPTYPFERKRHWVELTKQPPRNLMVAENEAIGSAIAKDFAADVSLPSKGTVSLPSTSNDVLFVEEVFIEKKLPVNQTDWITRISHHVGKRILVVYENDDDYTAINQLWQTVEQILPTKPDINFIFMKVCPEGIDENGAIPSRLQKLEISEFGSFEQQVIRFGADSVEVFEQWGQTLQQQGRLPNVIFFLGHTIPSNLSQESDSETRPINNEVHVVCGLIQLFLQIAEEQTIQGYYLFEHSRTQPQLELEALSGFTRSVILENSRHVYKTIRLDSTLPASQKMIILFNEWLLSQETISPYLETIRYQGVTRFVSTLREFEAPAFEASGNTFRRGAVYLITGGLGTIGPHLCHYLAETYQSTLIILGRSELTPEKSDQLQKLEQQGSQVWYYSVDITDFDALQQTMAKVKETVGQVDGVLHLAMSVEDSLAIDKTLDSFDRIIAAKVTGTVNLDKVTQQEPLAFFMIFSSMGAFGYKGMSAYGYATAFQNAFAVWRDKQVQTGPRQGKSVALGWGQWTMNRYATPARNDLLQQMGFNFLTIDLGFSIMNYSLKQDRVVFGAIAVRDKEKINRFYGISPKETSKFNSDILFKQILLDLQRGHQSKEDALQKLATIDLSQFSDQQIAMLHAHVLNNTSTPEQPLMVDTQNRIPPTSNISPAGIAALITETLQTILKLDNEVITSHKSFQDYGMDSITGTHLTIVLEQALGIEILPRWLIEYPTLELFTQKILEMVHMAKGTDNVG